VWAYDFGGRANIVEIYVSYLRRKLAGRPAPPIETVRGFGYVIRRPGGDPSSTTVTAHRSPLTAHRSPLTAHRSPLTARRSAPRTRAPVRADRRMITPAARSRPAAPMAMAWSRRRSRCPLYARTEDGEARDGLQSPPNPLMIRTRG